MTRFERLEVGANAAAFACVPFFPSFITLTNVAFPGVSIVPLPLALALLCAMLVLAVVAAIGMLRPPRYEPVLLRPMLLWLGACLVSLALGFNVRDGAVFILIFALTVLWHANIDRYYALPGMSRAIWWAYLLSGTLASIAAIAMVVTRIPAVQYTIANGRAVGTFVLPGELAGYLLFFLPIAFALARSAHGAALRALGWIGCVAGSIAMILTFSRTGWVGFAAGIAFLIVLRSNAARARVVQGIAIVVAAVASCC